MQTLYWTVAFKCTEHVLCQVKILQTDNGLFPASCAADERNAGSDQSQWSVTNISRFGQTLTKLTTRSVQSENPGGKLKFSEQHSLFTWPSSFTALKLWRPGQARAMPEGDLNRLSVTRVNRARKWSARAQCSQLPWGQLSLVSDARVTRPT